MELRQLMTFQKVAQTMSFSQTAVSLNYAQSTVSAQIQALEAELGVSLFDRIGKRINLTEAGKNLLGYAEKMLALAGEAKVVVGADDTPAGPLKISVPETLCTYRLPKLLRQYREQYPQVQLIFSARSDTTLQRPLNQGDLDIAFSIEEPIQSENLIVKQLITETLQLVTYPDHPLAHADFVTFTELRKEPFVLTETGCSYRNLFERTLAAHGVHLQTSMEFHSVEAIKQCVMAGIGLSLLPTVAVKEQIENGRLVTLPWQGEGMHLITQMAWHKDKWLSPAMRVFISLAEKTLRN